MKKLIVFVILVIGVNFMSCTSEIEENKSEVEVDDSDYTKWDEKKLSDDMNKLESSIRNLEDQLPDSLEVMKGLSNELYEKSSYFVNTFKNSDHKNEALNYKIKSAEGLMKFGEAINTIDLLINETKDTSVVIDLMMEKAFLYENHLNNKEKAKEVYQEIIVMDSTHPFAKDCKAILNNMELNLSDEDLIKMFEEKNKKS